VDFWNRVRYAIVGIVILYIALRIPGIGVPLDRDEGAFGHMGQLIHEGGLPYRDGLDHKPPIAFYINALALEFVPATERGIHWFLLVYNFLTLVCLFTLARIFFDSLAAGLWCAFCFAVFSASPDIQGFTASTEMWALLPICASLLAAVVGVRKCNAGLLMVSGALGAIACWTKQTMVFSIAFVLLYAALAPVADSRSRIRQAARNAGLWLAGAMVVSGGIVGYFAARGVLRDFVYWCFTYGFSYAKQVSIKDVAGDLRDALSDVWSGNVVILSIGIGVAAWTLWRARRDRTSFEWRWPVFVLGFLACSLAGTLPGYAYPHYFAQIAPAAALAAGQGIYVLLGRIRQGRARAWAAIGLAALILSTTLVIDHDYFFERDPNAISAAYFEDNPFPESKAVADFIASRTSPDDRVLIEGSEPQILFYAQRRSPTAFLMMYPLTITHPHYREFQERMMAEIEACPPKYIVAMVDIPYSLAWDESADLQIMRFLDTLIAKNYTLELTRVMSGSDGQWIDPPDGHVDPNTPAIAIYRRKE